MKKFGFISILLVFIFFNLNVFASNNDITSEATLFASTYYQDMLQIFYDESEKTDTYDVNNSSLGIPFIIIEWNKSTQAEIYYFPIYNNDKVIAVLSVLNTSDGYTASIDSNLVDFLNNIDYPKIDKKDIMMFYRIDNELYTEDSIPSLYSSEFTINTLSAHSNISNRFISADISYSISLDNPEIDVDNYTSSFSENTTKAKVCSLYNKKGQGSYGMCWAASMSTIVNYLSGLNVQPKLMCDNMLIGYDSGATIGQARTAMTHYYTNAYSVIRYSTVSADKIQQNINNKKPMYLSSVDTQNSNSGHAVVLYGYRIVSDSKYLVLWNPGLSNGAGATQVVLFRGTSTVFAYNNSTYRWRYTLSNS